MNLSNDTLFTAVAAFVDIIADAITREVATKMDTRINALELKLEATLDKAPIVFENMNARVQKLEDRFDHLETASDERIGQICENRIETALDVYEPAENIDEDALINTVLESYTFQDGVKDAVRNLTFTVGVN